jgi:putative hydrolase of the HAD superfamily
MLTGDDPHLASLLVANNGPASPDRELAVAHAPLLRFDRREPFLPLAAGYSIIRHSGPSPSFPRKIELKPSEFAIEYAIWWDWDIVHLYELEHVWVYLDSSRRPVRAEASWHGRYHSMGLNSLSGEQLTLYSEPGKHALAPTPELYRAGEKQNRWLCCQGAGAGGLLVNDLFAGLNDIKSSQTDRLVQAFLRSYAFIPTYQFNRRLQITSDRLVPWPRLFRWIPERVSRLVLGLQEMLRLGTSPLEPLECGRET